MGGIVNVEIHVDMKSKKGFTVRVVDSNE